MNDHSAAITARVAAERSAPQAPQIAPTVTPVAPNARFAPNTRVAPIAHTVAAVREALSPARLAGQTIGLVPTMGALHQGHLSLIEAARRECDVVVVSIFVNPSQFDEQADLLRYPRAHERDAALAQQAGADVIFVPEVSQIYPDGFSSAVEVLRITDRLEGAVRGSGHFRGVTTVVCKLLNITQPAVAYFGEKDAQQVAVVRRMVSDLDIPVRIEALPTVREPDGLAMSSRNCRLSKSERRQALSLHAALTTAQERVSAGERSAKRLALAAREELVSFGVEPEYVEIVNERSFEPIETLQGEALMLIAARVGQTRLIDNTRLGCPAAARQSRGSYDTHTQREQGDRTALCSA